MGNLDGKKKFGLTNIIIVGIASLLIGVVLTARFSVTPQIDAQNFWKERAEKTDTPQLEPNSFVRLAKELNPVVVNISTTQVVKQRSGVPFPEFKSPFEDFFGDEFRNFGEAPEREFKRQSLGSGFVINKEGYILTNNHVVENAEEIIVTLSDKKEKEYKAKVVGKDARLDVALIKIDANGDLPVAVLGDSDKLEIGEWVMAVGINTAIIAGGQGVGFATPINMAKAILIQLKEKGYVTRGWIGVSIQEVTPELAKSFGLKDKQGALVSSVNKDEPADTAGIKAGDIIIEFDGKEIKEVSDLPRNVASTPPGKTVKVKIMRDGKEKILTVTIGKMKEEEGEVAAAEEKEDKAPEKKFGLSVQSITPEIARRLDLKDTDGVVVTQIKPNSPAAASGIKSGDVIKEVNRKEVKNLKQYREALKAAAKDDTILFRIVRGGNTFYVAIKAKE